MLQDRNLPPSNFTFEPQRDYLGRPLPPVLDYERLPTCECGESFLQFTRERFPDILDNPTLQKLDEALLTLTIEFGARLKTSPHHLLNSCLSETFSEIISLLTTKRDELLRHSKASRAPADLFVGLEEETQAQLLEDT
jgi:hypothetical protein